jgi:uncharacterized protein YecE (DUF72 family)
MVHSSALPCTEPHNIAQQRLHFPKTGPNPTRSQGAVFPGRDACLVTPAPLPGFVLICANDPPLWPFSPFSPIEESTSCVLSMALGVRSPLAAPGEHFFLPPTPARNRMKTPHSAAGDPVFIGCSGWAYPTWKPGFYPAGVPSKRFLEHYATRLNSVEVNYTFRALPSAATVDAWLAQTGSEFRFSFKAPQRITHIRRLKASGAELRAFAEAIQPVVEAKRMGLVLFQLPPNMKADVERLAEFLDETKELDLRMAFEFRHASWFEEATYRVLERHKAALCVAESDELETPEVETAPFACYRLRKSEYSPEELKGIADGLMEKAQRGDVFAYFKHEDEPTGALRAEGVLRMVREREG